MLLFLCMCVRTCVCACVCSHMTGVWGIGSAEQGALRGPQGGGSVPGSGHGRPAGSCADTGSHLSPDDRICSPPFMELTSLCGDDTMRLLEKNGLAFPFSMYHTQGPAGQAGMWTCGVDHCQAGLSTAPLASYSWRVQEGPGCWGRRGHGLRPHAHCGRGSWEGVDRETLLPGLAASVQFTLSVGAGRCWSAALRSHLHLPLTVCSFELLPVSARTGFVDE